MAYETIKDFTEWCYNGYIDANKANRFQAADTLRDVLKQHLTLNLKAGKFVDQRRHARNLLEKIDKAAKTGNTSRLAYTGEKYNLQKETDINQSERILRECGVPEENITFLINLKRQNYGDQFF